MPDDGSKAGTKPIFPPQNDPGSTPDMTGARHFTTYMKARIYCEREVPSGREFVGALDYQYNDISEYTKHHLPSGVSIYICHL